MGFTDLRSLSISVPLGGFTARIRGWGFFEPRWWRNYLHEHSFFEICYAYAGHGTFLINNVLYPAQAGEVFVAKPGEPHEIVSSEADPLGIYFWQYTLVPPTGDVVHVPLDALMQAFTDSRLWVSSRVPAMQRTLEMLADEIERQEPGYADVIDALVTKLLVDTARAVTDLNLPDDRPAHNPTEAIVKDIARYLRDNYSRPLAIRDVAAQVHLSERHTNRLFRQVMGVSIKDYLTDFRLGVAKQLLLNRQMNVTEVAYASGYHDVRHFITLFRQRTGLTPARYRDTSGTVFLTPE